ncbi:putative methyltransferase-domain-containing protein [Pelagophyceae sp. CCMP2097]|nr:putative methyltransferase-domain-containing protein [Pelagophyceae sp. CCMP2097]
MPKPARTREAAPAAAPAEEADEWQSGQFNMRREVQIRVGGETMIISQDSNSSDCGTVLWEVAVIWARLLDAGALPDLAADKIAGRRILELGAGCGVAGMALALRGARVTFTDLPALVPHLEANVRRNLGARDFDVVGFDWSLEYPPRLVDQAFDLVLATDCVYHAHLVKPLLRALVQCCSKQTTLILVHERRDEDVLAEFESVLRKLFRVRQTASPAALRRALGDDVHDALLVRDHAGDGSRDTAWLTMLTCKVRPTTTPAALEKLLAASAPSADAPPPADAPPSDEPSTPPPL